MIFCHHNPFCVSMTIIVLLPLFYFQVHCPCTPLPCSTSLHTFIPCSMLPWILLSTSLLPYYCSALLPSQHVALSLYSFVLYCFFHGNHFSSFVSLLVCFHSNYAASHRSTIYKPSHLQPCILNLTSLSIHCSITSAICSPPLLCLRDCRIFDDH